MVLDTEITKNKVSPEGRLLLEEIAGESTTDYVRVEPDKRYVLGALGRHLYVERNGYDARITAKGLKAIGREPAERNGNDEDADRVIHQALTKKREAGSNGRQPVRTRIPDDFGQSALSEAETPPAAAEPAPAKAAAHDYEQDQIRYVGNRLASTIVPVTASAVPPTPAQPCTADCGNCLHRRVLDAVMQRLPEVRDLFEAMYAQEWLLEKLDKMGNR